MKGLHLNVDEVNGIMVIEAGGELDLNNSNDLKRIINDIVENDKGKVIFSCSDLRYIDSSGLGILIRLKATYKSDKSGQKKDVVLVNLSEEVQKVISLTKLDGFFTIMNTKEEAVSYFAS